MHTRRFSSSLLRLGTLALCLHQSLAAQPLPQLLREFRQGEALTRIEARLPHSSGAERLRLLLWKVECLTELDRLPEAAQILGGLPKQGASYFLLRGRLARRNGQDELARQDLEHALLEPPSSESCDAALFLATLHSENGRPADCDLAFSKCLEIAQSLPERQLNWLRIYYQRGHQLEKMARLTQAIDLCRLGSAHCERVSPGSSTPLRTLEATLLGRTQQYELADRCWKKLIERDTKSVGPLLAWGYDMLYQRSDAQGSLRWLSSSRRALEHKLRPEARLNLMLLQGQVALFRLHNSRQAEAILAAAQPLAPAKPHSAPGGWRVSLRFHGYGPDPSSELEWICWMRLMAMQRRNAPTAEIASFMKSAAPRLRAEERGPWLYELSKLDGEGAAREQALAVSRGLQRNKLLTSMLADGQIEAPRWRESLADLTSSEREQALDFLMDEAASSASRFSGGSPPLEALAKEYRTPLQPSVMLTRLEARQDVNRLVPLLVRQAQRLFSEGRRGEALASAYRLQAWGERSGEANTQASALYLQARIEAAAGRLERAAQMLEKSRQIRILKKERESEISAARAQRLVLEWMGQSEQARSLATEYDLAAQITGKPELMLSATAATTESREFLAGCARLAVDYPEFNTSVAMLPSRMVELHSSLGPQQVLLQLFVAPQETVVLVAAPEGFAIRRLVVSAELLQDWVKELRGQLLHPADAAVGEAVQALLLEPLAPLLKHRKVTLVCPGLLQDLPWDLLGADWNCWWLWAGEAAHPYPSPAEPQVLAIGDVPGIDLPATRVEVEQLAQLFPGHSQLLLGADATRPALERLARSSDIVHLATHASLDRQADRAHLSLADGAYSARQVFACPLKPGALVVLSACNTANSRAQERAPTTLANAFLAAGASQVVATLAPVEDQAARLFFASFYGQLKAGLAPAEALQRAKSERRRASPDQNWAAFVLLGSCP